MPVRDEYLASRQQAILDAAQRVFLRRGFAATTMQDVAGEAGVSVGNLYRYFENKEHLIRSVCERCEAQYDELMAGAARSDASPFEMLLMLVERVWGQIRTERDDAALLVEATALAAHDPEIRATLADFLHSTRTFVAGVIAAARERGEVREDIDRDAMAMVLMAIVSGIRALHVQLGDEAVSPSLERATAMLIEGLAPRPSSTPAGRET